jgi:RNA recognition motif-containing protein
MAQKLFIGGIAFTTTSEGLRDFFAQAGPVLSADVVMDQATGRSRGFGFVEMETAEAAEKAVAQLNGRDLDGRALRVEISKPKPAGGGRSGGFGGGGGRSGGGGNWR